MEQSKTMSFVEATTSSFIGFVVSVFANLLVLPLFGFDVKFYESLSITMIFTVVSVIRAFVIRRLFSSLNVKRSS